MPRPEDERALQGWRELLEVMYTPDEAAVASRMPMVPTSLGRLDLAGVHDTITLRATRIPGREAVDLRYLVLTGIEE